jgi:hypothetical protein
MGARPLDGVLDRTTQLESNAIAGAVLIRTPPAPGQDGPHRDHRRPVGTVEAAGVNLGVRRDRIEGRLWHYVVKVPGSAYASTGYVAPVKPLPYLLTLETPCIKSALVRTVQRALRDKGVDPGKIDGEYGPAHRRRRRSLSGDEQARRRRHLRAAHGEKIGNRVAATAT